MEWNFFESGHGKGVPDAIGGALKRNADRNVKYGNDVTSAKDFVQLMNESSTQCYLVKESEINNIQSSLQKQKLKTVPGTMKLHQLLVIGDNEIAYRDASCNCRYSQESGHIFRKTMLTDEHPEELVDPLADPTGNTGIKCDKLLQELKSCRSYCQLKKNCLRFEKEMVDISLSQEEINFMNFGLEVDSDAMDFYPNDVPDKRALYPSKVPADGNCLPSSGSVLACGSSVKATEIRIRILIELVLNDSKYLDSEFLQRGLPIQMIHSSVSLPKIYAQYSDMFNVGMALDENGIRNVYQMEVMKIRLDKSYMGIWQIHALSSVLNTPIFFNLPKVGQSQCQKRYEQISSTKK